MKVSSMLQKTVVNMAMREAVGCSIGKVCLPTSLSPITSLKSCACEVVASKHTLHPRERSASGVICLLSSIFEKTSSLENKQKITFRLTFYNASP